MKSKSDTFLVNIAILEGRHFAWPSMDSAVHVQVSNQKKCTTIRNGTDCPFFNELFVFEFMTIFDKFVDETITLTVIEPRKIWRSKKILGYITLDIGTVWTQPDHQFYHKWAIINAPIRDPTGGPRGYIKVDINVLTKGESPKIPGGEDDTDEIEGNLLLPEGMSTERQRAKFIFNVYRGENLNLNKKKMCTLNLKKDNTERDAPNPYIEICFAGLKAQTSTRKHSTNPAWNERLILTEFFPPLCQRVKVTLCYEEPLHNTKYAVRHLNLREISNDGENGFLPVFGPSFVYFYSHFESYAGKVLMSITTEIESNTSGGGQSITVEEAEYLLENNLWKEEEVLLFATIFDVSLIDKKYSDKPIKFELLMGPCDVREKDVDETGEGIPRNMTSALSPCSNDKLYWHLNYGEQKPCMVIQSIWPDLRKRMCNSNIINKISSKLKVKLDEIEELFENQVYRVSNEEIEKLITDTVDFIITSCRKYIDIAKCCFNVDAGTELDMKRTLLCIKEMEDIEVIAAKLYNPRMKKRSFRKIQALHTRMELLIKNAQDCWPDIFIWMHSGPKKVAVHRMRARKIAYSVIEEEAGRCCGRVESIFFDTCSKKKNKTCSVTAAACKADIFIWVGLQRHKEECFNVIPRGFVHPSKLNKDDIPHFLVAQNEYIFQARAHIYQGRFHPGSDDSGLCDPFVRVIIGQHCKETKIVSSSINPFWDQTLLFQNIIIYGEASSIQQEPLRVVLEVFDQDCCRKEFVGRSSFRPQVKLIKDPYKKPQWPPELCWYKIYKRKEVVGDVLAVVELLEASGLADEHELKLSDEIVSIPDDIKPSLVEYRIDVIFWGVRELKKVHQLSITKPKITIQCSTITLHSETLLNAKKCLNFPQAYKYMDISLPNQEIYAPPVCIKMYDCRSFGRYTYAGTHLAAVQQFMYNPLSVQQRTEKLTEVKVKRVRGFRTKAEPVTEIKPYYEEDSNISSSESSIVKESSKWKAILRKVFKINSIRRKRSTESTKELDVEDFDWWTKYYASVEGKRGKKRDSATGILISKSSLKIYPNELERQAEFKGFMDTLISFPIYKGKRTGDETVDEQNITGVFKGALRIYKWPPKNNIQYITETGFQLQNGSFQDMYPNEPLRYILRIYCVKGIALRPKDLNGKCDPYLRVIMNENVINDRDNYVSKQTTPIFGRCFEIKAMFPQDHTVTISVWDWDLTTSDDLIGETKIDLENRLYTRHRASCGLAKEYQESGYCWWRDQHKPSHILNTLCNLNNVEVPVYTNNSVIIGCKEFQPPENNGSGDVNHKEQAALAALHRWNEMPVVGYHLVPEHVETRTLYHPTKPGIEQGKIQLWIDIFPCDLPPPTQVDITPRKPLPYELRVIIWNTEDVFLQEDDFFVGEKMSDIYVKGWLANPKDNQSTDVHYRSMTGEGNFNWRFVFPFKYLSTENKLVLTKKESVFSVDQTDYKIPCKLTLQILDNDTFSADDFLGMVTLELSRLPRGSRSSKKCSLKIVEPNAPTVNLFKIKRTKGWWPFRGVHPESNEDILAGKIEAEFQLVTAEEAEANPVGLGREDPQPLIYPKRPDTSFSWFRNPIKALKFLICKHYRWEIISVLIFLLLVCLVAAGVYSVPGYIVKKILNA